jgi:hypothetical protein
VLADRVAQVFYVLDPETEKHIVVSKKQKIIRVIATMQVRPIATAKSPRVATWSFVVVEGVLDHLSCSIIEDEASFNLANFVHQLKIFLHAREN